MCWIPEDNNNSWIFEIGYMYAPNCVMTLITIIYGIKLKSKEKKNEELLIKEREEDEALKHSKWNLKTYF